jgi:hypothetical protein
MLMVQLVNINQYFIRVLLKHIHNELNFVIPAIYFDHPEQLIVMIVICVYKDLIIIVLGLAIVLGKEITNIFTYFCYL